MAEKPIAMCAEMVRAILAGRKTVTRRVITKLPSIPDGYSLCFEPWKDGRWEIGCYDGEGGGWKLDVRKAPYQPGDILWVREGLRKSPPELSWGPSFAIYTADDAAVSPCMEWRWTKVNGYKRDRDYLPSIFMPREACRIRRLCVSCTPERLQDITDAEMEAEGMGFVIEETNLLPVHTMVPPGPRIGFVMFWDKLNAKRGYPWAGNWWVWRTEFEGADG